MALVQGVGINDAPYEVTRRDGRKIVWVCPFYRTWKDLLARCYSEKCKGKNPTYRDCQMVADWLRFSVFRLWMQAQPWCGNELDKDLLKPGNRVYGPDTCIFICSRVNTFILESAANRGEWPLGVSWAAHRNKFKASCRSPFEHRKQQHLGYFACPDAAHRAWKARKLEHAVALACQQTDERVAMALVARYC